MLVLEQAKYPILELFFFVKIRKPINRKFRKLNVNNRHKNDEIHNFGKEKICLNKTLIHLENERILKTV